MVGLVLLTCHHMEEGKVPSSMAGSQDALLLTLIGMVLNRTMLIIMKIMYVIGITASGTMLILNTLRLVFASTD